MAHSMSKQGGHGSGVPRPKGRVVESRYMQSAHTAGRRAGRDDAASTAAAGRGRSSSGAAASGSASAAAAARHPRRRRSVASRDADVLPIPRSASAVGDGITNPGSAGDAGNVVGSRGGRANSLGSRDRRGSVSSVGSVASGASGASLVSRDNSSHAAASGAGYARGSERGTKRGDAEPSPDVGEGGSYSIVEEGVHPAHRSRAFDDGAENGESAVKAAKKRKKPHDLPIETLRRIHDVSTAVLVSWHVASMRQQEAFAEQQAEAQRQLHVMWSAGRIIRRQTAQMQLDLAQRQRAVHLDTLVRAQHEAVSGIGEDLKRLDGNSTALTKALRDMMAWVPTSHVSPTDAEALKGRLEVASAALVGTARAESIAAGAGSVREVAGLLGRLVELSAAAEAELQNAAALLRRVRADEVVERSLRIGLMQQQGLA